MINSEFEYRNIRYTMLKQEHKEKLFDMLIITEDLDVYVDEVDVFIKDAIKYALKKSNNIVIDIKADKLIDTVRFTNQEGLDNMKKIKLKPTKKQVNYLKKLISILYYWLDDEQIEYLYKLNMYIISLLINIFKHEYYVKIRALEGSRMTTETLNSYNS